MQHERHTHADERDDRDQRGQQAVLDQRLELVDVRRHPGHDPSGHLALVVVEREPLQLGEDPDAQGEHDPLCGPAGHERFADLVDEVGKGDDEEDPTARTARSADPFATPLSMPVLTSTGPSEADHAVEHDEQQADQQRPAELAPAAGAG